MAKDVAPPGGDVGFPLPSHRLRLGLLDPADAERGPQERQGIDRQGDSRTRQTDQCTTERRPYAQRDPVGLLEPAVRLGPPLAAWNAINPAAWTTPATQRWA